jgi:regulation of enolase protein 1 (concanavalin A-like superfamily)
MAWLEETLAGPTLDVRLRWHNPPPDWSPGRDGLVVRTAAGTDFWQGTHYGFRVDNGHLFAAQVEGDFVLETEVVAAPVHQYDQAGLMVRLSERCWLKTSVEAEPGEPSRLGSVVTNAGWSDWSTQDLDPDLARHVAFRVTRRGADYLVEAATVPDGRWSQIRLGRLHEDEGGPVLAGLYACSPKGEGFAATFKRLRIERTA